MYTVFPRISAWALISYRASETRRLNETGCLFEAGAYFLSLIIYHLFRRYGGPTPFSNCGAPTWFVSTSYKRPPPTAVMAFVCTLKKLPAKRQGFSAIWRSKTQSLDERQWEFVWQIDHSTNDRLLDAKLAVKLCVHAVCEARPLGTLAFIRSPTLISYRAVKPPVFKRGLAFIQVRSLFEEIRYTCKLSCVGTCTMYTYGCCALFLFECISLCLLSQAGHGSCFICGMMSAVFPQFLYTSSTLIHSTLPHRAVSPWTLP